MEEIYVKKCKGLMRKKRITRMLQLQATAKRFQFDIYVNLEGQHMLISSWSQKISLLKQIDESNCTKHV